MFGRKRPIALFVCVRQKGAGTRFFRFPRIRKIPWRKKRSHIYKSLQAAPFSISTSSPISASPTSSASKIAIQDRLCSSHQSKNLPCWRFPPTKGVIPQIVAQKGCSGVSGVPHCRGWRFPGVVQNIPRPPKSSARAPPDAQPYLVASLPFLRPGPAESARSSIS